MNRRAVAAALILCVMMASVSCSDKPSPTVIHEAETFGTSGTTRAEPGFMDEVYEQVVLSSEAGVTYDFKYDSDILAYTGQGGNFYLVGSDATKCFLHVIIQDQVNESFDDAKTAYQGSITKEFTLESGRRAFIYTTDDASNIHVVIDAEGIINSGKGLISIYIGAVETWPFSGEQIADQVEKGF